MISARFTYVKGVFNVAVEHHLATAVALDPEGIVGTIIVAFEDIFYARRRDI